jgi:hypothetical protein
LGDGLMDKTGKVKQMGNGTVTAKGSTNEYHKCMGGSNQRVV